MIAPQNVPESPSIKNRCVAPRTDSAHRLGHYNRSIGIQSQRPRDAEPGRTVFLNSTSKQDEITMLNYLAAYGAITLVMLAIDFVWLGFIAKSFYRDSIGHLMADPPNLIAGGIFYLLYPIGVLLFAVAPITSSTAAGLMPWSKTILAGALFGFFCYATYDLTNLATLRGWPLRVVLVDIAFGTALTAAAAAAGRWALGRMT